MLSEPFVTDYCRANMWLVRGRDLDMLVDTGMGICALAPEIDIVPGKPLLVVATHVHLDHVGSLHEFSWRAGPRIEAAFFETMPDEATYANMFRNFPGAVSELPWPGWSSADYAIVPAPLDRLLDDGDVIELGDRSFTVLHLPGHSPGSIGLFDCHDGTLFSGDAIHCGLLVDDMPDSDRTAYCATMRRLIDLPVSIAHGGHADSIDGTRMREIAMEYLRRNGG
ncbi:MBL fold metallo-hydrolase [Aminobacter sp. NyZ550]|uniref:MBL fold metallo-hydrolase n=1 Tax=Aminobacter sp. NyZ550 TaxID=2979870 RepID=UPI0021D57D0B|nr:MBL fold metallo-hydrolase [Aminobacter sp. NyZ550]WAX97887.1 MBL fold metallo-hydrolase [Aminobacter sp. NyZ550]